MFEPAPAGTRVAFAGDGTSGLFLNLLEPRVTAAAKPAVRRDLVNLKAVLEASVRPTTAVPTGGAGGALRSVA